MCMSVGRSLTVIPPHMLYDWVSLVLVMMMIGGRAEPDAEYDVHAEQDTCGDETDEGMRRKEHDENSVAMPM